MKSLVDLVREAGVIGCGGAGFPTHVKIDAKVDLVLANGAECEPLLNSDQRVMEHYADELLEGLRLIMDHVGARKGIVGVKESYHHAIEVLKSRLERYPGITLGILGNYYPAGDEHILLTDLTGRVVPEGGLPLHVGAVVSNVLTMVQVARAARGEPVTEREVTLAGEVKYPQVVTAPIGTPVSQLLERAVPKMDLSELAIIDGGPMMGKEVEPTAVVRKTTSGFLFLPKNLPLLAYNRLSMSTIERRSIAACCQCRLCTDACSRYMQGHHIEPHLVMRTLAYKSSEPTRAMTAAFLCSQCGLCEFACPMNLSPRRVFAEVLRELRAAQVKNPHHYAPDHPHEFNRFRKIGKDRLIRRYGLLSYDSHDLPLTTLPEPLTVFLELRQSAGAPSRPVVKVGEAVRKGQLLASIPDGKLGSNLHASIRGTVISITPQHIVVERAS